MKTYVEITTPKDPEFLGRYLPGRCLCVYQQDVCIERILISTKGVQMFKYGIGFDDLSKEWNYKIITEEKYKEFKLECL